MSVPLLRLSMFLLVALGSGTGSVLRAAEGPDPAPPPGRPTREELRESFKNLTPEERASRLKALRENGSFAGPAGPAGDALRKRRDELEKFRETLKDLPPEQRQARIKEWRETNAVSRPFATMSPEERDAQRKVFQKRIEEQIAALNKKKESGSLTEDETLRLQNMQRMLKRLESAPAIASPKPPLGLPPPATPSVKPTNPDSPATPQEPSDGK